MRCAAAVGLFSVAIAVVLGIATILAIVAFINHSPHVMDVCEILERIRREPTDQIRTEWTPRQRPFPANGKGLGGGRWRPSWWPLIAPV